ncbi:P-loop containing nucleoside triphosphate hydrolase protein [Exidia glandulosa HHB12029]|uniref:Origin recognition complex subunit 1 n=1 Tax=Exidia glandulosa HHB12029 TaxID=1314781 RepID=A0A166B8C8_EXIGL|nr:P-loop containing nucleoside triphosphate hydrolase protein [Exidia glandulosa HHB12029]
MPKAKASTDPYVRVMNALHVGSRPDELPCRQAEKDEIYNAVTSCLEDGSGGCIYISGVPGTGKTATVHNIARKLQAMAKGEEFEPFRYLEINGLKIPEPTAAYALLWEAVSAHDVKKHGHLRISAKEALKKLTRHFETGAGEDDEPIVVLMDELDQLMTAKQDVVYNFFNWPTLKNSRLIVIAVANTHDMPERVMSGKVRSRLGMQRINFKPYTWQQLQEIVDSRVASAAQKGKPPPKILSKDAIAVAARRVASVSGDARRVLDICRRAVEVAAEDKSTVQTADIDAVIRAMQNSPTAAYIRQCSLHERIMLAALHKVVRREGVAEVQWGWIMSQHLNYVDNLPEEGESRKKPTPAQLKMVLNSLHASRAVIVEDGPAAARRPDWERKVMLNVEPPEVERVLSEMGGSRWKNALGI